MQYYVKSLEEDFCLKSLKRKKKVNFQSLTNIVKTKTIKPNTKSFGQKRRLACTALHKNYVRTYRAQGIIFTTKQKPECCLPFDLVLLSDADNIIVHYYRIQNNLHVYYNHQLIPGFEQFIFDDFSNMIKKYSSPEKVWKAVNDFREKNKHKKLPKTKYKLIQYNEIIFNKEVNIQPIAIYGYRKEAREIAKNLGLPHYRNAKEFYESLR